MHYLKLNLSAEDTYFIAAQNDTRLEMIVELIIDDAIRSQLKEILESLTGLPVGNILPITIADKQFEIQQGTNNILIIRMFNHNKTMETLETDIMNDTFLNLIDQWEDVILENPQEIEFSREQDNFYITSFD